MSPPEQLSKRARRRNRHKSKWLVGLMLLAFYHFGGKTMTKAEAVSLLMQAVGWFGGLSVVSIGVAAFVSKLIADRSIESHKAQLGQETERLKGLNDMGPAGAILRWADKVDYFSPSEQVRDVLEFRVRDRVNKEIRTGMDKDRVTGHFGTFDPPPTGTGL